MKLIKTISLNIFILVSLCLISGCEYFDRYQTNEEPTNQVRGSYTWWNNREVHSSRVNKGRENAYNPNY